jgi:hypothetical protein
MAAKLLTAAGGGITLDAASTATDKTVTIPARTGNVAIDGPAFSAYPSATQSISSGTTTKIQFNTEDFDTASCYNNTGSTVGGIPAYAFLPNVAGYYQVNLVVSCVAAIGIQPAIFKNGSYYTYGNYSTTSQWGSASTLVYMNGSTDYIDGYIYTAASTTTQAGVAIKFQAFLARAA